MDFFSPPISEMIRNYAFVAGGAFGLYLAWLRVTASNRQAESQLKQTELARRVHVTEVFNRAVGQLKDRKLEVRLGAILTLEQICNDYEDLSGPVLKLLATYLRENALRYGDRKPPVDVQTIMDILKEHQP